MAPERPVEATAHKKDKRQKVVVPPGPWFTTVKDAGDGSGDCILELPDDLIKYAGWKVGDTLDLSLGVNNEIILHKKR